MRDSADRPLREKKAGAEKRNSQVHAINTQLGFRIAFPPNIPIAAGTPFLVFFLEPSKTVPVLGDA
jgi:hypothetical protein